MAAVVDTRIEGVKARALEMMGLVRDSLEESVRSLDDRDVDLADGVIGREQLVNALEARIDQACLEILTEKIEGRPLRMVAATFKLVSDVERIGDYCVAIADVTRALANKPVTINSLSLTKMANVALGMLDQCVAAYGGDAGVDLEFVFGQDGRIDKLYDDVFVHAISSILQEPKSVTNTMYVTVASRALERIGDHITNIAEDIAFIGTGKLVRRDEAVYVPEFP
ncbi:MAG TPA: phosphate signaling complex protein PhoU [Methanocella sp.]|nr:phosphate signaling complex protein PhoU [Methanocella sp.]